MKDIREIVREKYGCQKWWFGDEGEHYHEVMMRLFETFADEVNKILNRDDE